MYTKVTYETKKTIAELNSLQNVYKSESLLKYHYLTDSIKLKVKMCFVHLDFFESKAKDH